MPPYNPPHEILILGSGVFGLSTALALTQRPTFASSKITVVDRSPFPAPDGSSIDTSRIIRPDYADAAYASLAQRAQNIWRDPLSPFSPAYSESGLILTANTASTGLPYVKSSLTNVLSLLSHDPPAITVLSTPSAIASAVSTGGSSGDWGYINRRSGWADAEAGMRILHHLAVSSGRITFLTLEAVSLLYSKTTVTGARFADGTEIFADLTVVATGAWSGGLVDLEGRAQATGQVLCYMDITDAEQKRLEGMPVLLNMSTGLFIIPPKDGVLKVARHGYGYTNPQGEEGVSVPRTKWDDAALWVPREGEDACRQALSEIVPSLATRPFNKTRLCWYTDTPTGDFIITYHPSHPNLFLATGGSGHGYKFLPVIGDEIVDIIEGREKGELREKWRWRDERVEHVVTEDGSRGGRSGMRLDVEMGRGRGSKL